MHWCGVRVQDTNYQKMDLNVSVIRTLNNKEVAVYYAHNRNPEYSRNLVLAWLLAYTSNQNDARRVLREHRDVVTLIRNSLGPGALGSSMQLYIVKLQARVGFYVLLNHSPVSGHVTALVP